MNVLVYSGPEVHQSSLNYALTSLRSILLPHYTVQPITLKTLSSEPWAATCALLVFPRCHDRFVSPAAKVIQDYVHEGGAYLALGSGAECTPRGFGGGSITLGSSLSQPLRFFDKVTNSYIYPLLHGGGKIQDPELVNLSLSDGHLSGAVCEIGTNPFDGFEAWQGITILARYSQNNEVGSIAGIIFDVGRGKIAIWAPSLELPLTQEPAKTALERSSVTYDVDLCKNDRNSILRNTLLQLGILLPAEPERIIRNPLPQLLTSIPSKPTIVSQILSSLAAPGHGSELKTLEDENDTFHFSPASEGEELLRERSPTTEGPADPLTWQPKHVIVYPDGQIPKHSITPLFDHSAFYIALSDFRKAEGCQDEPGKWGIGEALLYSEAVTSTQTMLDKNPRLLASLPPPILSLASYQLAGRGRGSNIWLSPTGCLQFSILLRVSLSQLPANKLVFIQYLFATAVVEAFHSILGNRADRVRLKWPNDIYALVGAQDEKKKIGGVLVSTSFLGGNVDIIIGCGLNLLNSPPITSVAQLLTPEDRKILTIERTAAAIMAKFESMWNKFVSEHGSFDPFMNLYLKRWLHS
ncbi:biotin-ligase [Cyathus striatus]|nr:biotin-ligase [Cyathus striatus]